MKPRTMSLEMPLRRSPVYLLATLALSWVLGGCTARRDEPRRTGDSAVGEAAGAGLAAADDLEAHLRGLRAKAPEGFTIVPVPPFVVVGQGTAAQVQPFVEMVRWTVEKMTQDFVSTLPAQLTDIWLFPDDRSYRDGAWRLFRDRPSTPFGYYSPREGALIMNISTGGGTLVHEIVHPLLHADFPELPPWFNECMAALYEQSGEEDGHIVGFANWRLPGLQKAIREGRAYPFAELFRMTGDDFYVNGTGRETAEARYICLYLQAQGLLPRYYKEFRTAPDRDPTGENTLLEVCDEETLDVLQARWEGFVLGLSAP